MRALATTSSFKYDNYMSARPHACTALHAWRSGEIQGTVHIILQSRTHQLMALSSWLYMLLRTCMHGPHELALIMVRCKYSWARTYGCTPVHAHGPHIHRGPRTDGDVDPSWGPRAARCATSTSCVAACGRGGAAAGGQGPIAYAATQLVPSACAGACAQRSSERVHAW